MGAAVVDQVELDVAAATRLLKGALGVAIRFVLATANDRDVRFKKGAAAVAHESKELLEIALQIVKKNSADAPRLVAVRQEKIVVTPALETLVIGHAGVALANVLPCPVKMDHVFAEGVIRRQVGAAAEPLFFSLREEAEVGVNGGHERIAWMQHQRNTGG